MIRAAEKWGVALRKKKSMAILPQKKECSVVKFIIFSFLKWGMVFVL